MNFLPQELLRGTMAQQQELQDEHDLACRRQRGYATVVQVKERQVLCKYTIDLSALCHRHPCQKAAGACAASPQHHRRRRRHVRRALLPPRTP